MILSNICSKIKTRYFSKKRANTWGGVMTDAEKADLISKLNDEQLNSFYCFLRQLQGREAVQEQSSANLPVTSQ